MSGQIVWQKLYKCLKDAGFDVYTPGQHEDYCGAAYCVVSQDRVTPDEDTTAGHLTLTVIAFVPVDQYSALDGYVQSIRQALEPMHSEVAFTGSTVYEVDQNFRAHKATLTYRAMQPDLPSDSQQEGWWITGIEQVELLVEDETYTLRTATQCKVDPIFSLGEQQVLRGEGKAVAWMPPEDVVVGYSISLQDVTVVPEVFAVVDGGQITEQNGVWTSYQGPDLLQTWEGKDITLRITSRQKSSSDQTGEGIRLTFERCRGQALPFVWKNGAFWSPSYTLLSRGTLGGSAYLMERMDESQREGEHGT